MKAPIFYLDNFILILVRSIFNLYHDVLDDTYINGICIWLDETMIIGFNPYSYDLVDIKYLTKSDKFKKKVVITNIVFDDETRILHFDFKEQETEDDIKRIPTVGDMYHALKPFTPVFVVDKEKDGLLDKDVDKQVVYLDIDCDLIIIQHLQMG